MKDLLLNPGTRQRLENFAKTPSHALLLVGPAGSGKNALAQALAETVLELEAGSFDDYPYKMVIGAGDGKSVGIDEVRAVESFLSLKVPRRTAHNRAIIIQDAHGLTAEAQNALLKTLEEPPAGTFIILNASQEQALLPTIRSRAQTVAINRPSQQDAENYFLGKGFEKPAVQKAKAVSGGLPGLMLALLQDEEHPLLQATAKARQLLSQTAYERLLMVDELSKQRQLAIDTAYILQQMARLSLRTAQGPAAAKWQAVLKAAYEAQTALAGSAQPKLALTKLMLSF